MCGDATKKGDVEKLMGDMKADMVFTDPPYNIGLDYHSYDDKKDIVEFEQMIKDSYSNAISLLNTPAHFTFTYKVKGIPEMLEWCKGIGLEFRHIAVWHNPQRKAGSYPGMWGYGYEPIMNFSVGGWKKLNNKNGVGYSDVFIEDSPIKKRKGNESYHPAEKPLKVWSELLKLMSNKDDIVLDLFGGSGSTLIACEQTNRICYMMELDPKYCDVIQTRYNNYIENNN
jgi:DNA modification methylase